VRGVLQAQELPPEPRYKPGKINKGQENRVKNPAWFVSLSKTMKILSPELENCAKETLGGLQETVDGVIVGRKVGKAAKCKLGIKVGPTVGAWVGAALPALVS